MKNNIKKYIALFVAIFLLIFDYTFTEIVKKKYAVPISSSQITQVNDESIYSSYYDNETLVSTIDNEPEYYMILGLSQITLASVVLLLTLLNR